MEFLYFCAAVGISYFIYCLYQCLSILKHAYPKNILFRIARYVILVFYYILVIPATISFISSVFSSAQLSRAAEYEKTKMTRLEAIRQGKLKATAADFDEMDNYEKLNYLHSQYSNSERED